MEELIFSNDPYRMNWLRGDFPYGQIFCPPQLLAKEETTRRGDFIDTEILLTNRGEKPFFSYEESIGIRFPLPDQYECGEDMLNAHCHTHIFCGGDVSYIMALRMSGKAPHLGMVLTEGSLAGYSVERDLNQRSNDRGCFILHPSPMEFAPGETKRIAWRIFPHQGREDFFQKCGEYSRFVKVWADCYVLFPGEANKIFVAPSFTAESVKMNGKRMDFVDGIWEYAYTGEKLGEEVFLIEVDGVRTWCRIFTQEHPEILAKKRCHFIAGHQQYHGRLQMLQGAFLAYDNEEKHIVYTPENDYNGGRERVGMGLLTAKYLQLEKRMGRVTGETLQKSLLDYVDFVKRELVDVQTGKVCNDIGMDDSYKRLYNAPWYAALFTELYALSGNKDDLNCACRIIRFFYKEGGRRFYPIELPIFLLYQFLLAAGMESEAEEMKVLFCEHADQIAQRGTDYPASEVNYEQSIVAPAAAILLEVYQITEDGKYLEAGKKQLAVLEIFNGMQPDYHMHEVAIRHWDGYWFGKRKMYGDTFPHYWSALTGEVFEKYAKITGEQEYFKRAEDSHRAVLPLFFPDGAASCAYVYPKMVNGRCAAFFDPYANDQDWGLYLYLRAQG